MKHMNMLASQQRNTIKITLWLHTRCCLGVSPEHHSAANIVFFYPIGIKLLKILRSEFCFSQLRRKELPNRTAGSTSFAQGCRPKVLSLYFSSH